MGETNIDATDKTILERLHRDSRQSPGDIAAELDLTAEEVEERIAALEEAEVITRYTVMVDSAKLGYISAAFGFEVKPGRTDEIADELRRHDNIYKLWILSGRHNIIAHANFEDITHFQSFSHDTLHDIEGINNYETSIATKTVIDEGTVILTDS